MNKFFKNRANIYFLIWCLYLLKGTLYTEGTIINQGLMLLVLLLTFVETIRSLQSRKRHKVSGFFRALSMLVIMFTVYGIVLVMTDGLFYNQRPTVYYLENAYVSLLPIYVIFLYTQKGLITVRSLQIWMVAFLIVGICEYYKMQREMLALILEAGSVFDEGTNNAGNLLVYLIPGMLVYRKKPILLYAGLAICTLFIIMAMKRGAILLCAVSVILIVRNTISMSKRWTRALFYVLAILGVFIITKYVDYMLESSDYFNYRIQQTLEGNTSDRDIVYKEFWNMYSNQYNTMQSLFGRGAWATLKTKGYFAHNDWLELLVNQGLLGALLLLYFLYRFFIVSRDKELSSESRFCLLIIWIIVSIRTIISMSITGMSIFSTAILGFALADGFRYNLGIEKR